MSLINQMLKDLETNKSTKPRDGEAILKKLRSAESEHDPRIMGSWSVVLVAFIGVVLVGVLLFRLASAWHQVRLANSQVAAMQQYLKVQKNAAVPVASTSKKTLSGVGVSSVAIHPTAMSTLSSDFTRATQLLSLGDAFRAKQLLENIVLHKPNFLPARLTLANLAVTQGRFTDAKDILHAGLLLSPHNVELVLLQSRVLASLNDVSGAIALMTSISPPLADHTNYYATLAAFYQRQAAYDNAAQLYHQLVQYDPSEGVWWMGLGIAMESSGHNNAAVEAFQHALNASGLTPEVHAYVTEQLNKLTG